MLTDTDRLTLAIASMQEASILLDNTANARRAQIVLARALAKIDTPERFRNVEPMPMFLRKQAD